MPPPSIVDLERQLEKLEERFRESTEELRTLRDRLKVFDRAKAEVRAEIAEIRDEWEAADHRWWILTLAGLLTLFVLSYFFYTNLGWYADQRALPPSSDWLLDRLPQINVLPLLSWGWLALHLFAAGAAIAYTPRRMPFLLFLFTVYMVVRTLYVFLSPIGAPQRILDMRELDFIFSRIIGTYTFQNEFVFSGHTAIPFLFSLYFETTGLRRLFLAGSVVMAVAVLLTHNHYTVDVLSAYFMGFAVFKLSEALYARFVRPLFLRRA